MEPITGAEGKGRRGGEGRAARDDVIAIISGAIPRNVGR